MTAPASIVSSPGQYQTGWTAGAGVEFAVSGNWRAKLEYDYIDLSRRMYDLSAFGLPGLNVDPNIHLVKLGLNYRFGDAPLWTAPVSANAKPALPESTDWNVHAQTTFLPSAYPAFRSPYAGTDSLPGGGQARETWTTTAFLGVRLWQGGEFYFNPELAQGFGLNGTLGLAGFPNGEAQKAGSAYPKYPAAALLPQADIRARRRTGRRRRCRQSAAGQARHRPRHIDRRPLRGRRFFRQQQLRPRSARGFHELGDVVVRRL